MSPHFPSRKDAHSLIKSAALSLVGFDPFDECNKGLADLLASEKQAALGSNIQEVRPNASRATWPDLTADTSKDLFTQINKDASQQYSLFGNTSQGAVAIYFAI